MEVFAVNSQKRLIKDFPFNVTRNPLYVGLIMFAVGASLYMNSLVSLIGALIFIIFMNIYIIKFEEKDLKKNFGQAYSDYKNKVRRWI